MATVTILGRSFEIAPFKLGALKLAAPHIDAINATSGALTTMEGMIASAEHTIAILAVGLSKLDPTLTVEKLTEEIGFEDFPLISRAVSEILSESGLAPKGEAKAPSEPAEVAPEGASPAKSGTSSAS